MFRHFRKFLRSIHTINISIYLFALNWLYNLQASRMEDLQWREIIDIVCKDTYVRRKFLYRDYLFQVSSVVYLRGDLASHSWDDEFPKNEKNQADNILNEDSIALVEGKNINIGLAKDKNNIPNYLMRPLHSEHHYRPRLANIDNSSPNSKHSFQTYQKQTYNSNNIVSWQISILVFLIHFHSCWLPIRSLDDFHWSSDGKDNSEHAYQNMD